MDLISFIFESIKVGMSEEIRVFFHQRSGGEWLLVVLEEVPVV